MAIKAEEITSAIKKQLEAFEKKTGAIIVEGFGLTESSPVTHINPFAEGRRKVGSIGLPVSDTRCRIVDPADGEADMPVGKPGELLIQGPQVMKGYWNRPEETAETLRDGWLHTGDIAQMDEDGYFYIVDRKKDMIISSGYNVYPRDIEEVLFPREAPDQYLGREEGFASWPREKVPEIELDARRQGFNEVSL